MNINLKTEAFEKEQEKIRFGKALPLAIAIFVILLAGYGALLFLTKDTEKKIASKQEEYASKENIFKNGDAKDVLDFQNRLSESKKLFGDYKDGINTLSSVEKNMVPGVYLSSLKFDAKNNSLNLTCMASGFDQVARQILAFNKSELFSSVDSGDSDVLEQEGKIIFPVKLVLKEEIKN